MKKRLSFLVTLGGVLCFSFASAQVPRLSLHEEFTGETCPPCASSDIPFDAVMASPTNTPKVVGIKWLAPIPSAPSPTWSLYKTNKIEIDWRYKPSPSGYGYTVQNTSTTTPSNGIPLAPMGQLDGQDQWVFGATSNHVLYMNAAVVDSAHSFSSPFSVTLAKTWDLNMTTMTLKVNIVAAQNFTSTGALIFRAVMIEKVVTFSVAPGFGGQTVFYNPVIASFPSLQAGTPLPQVWTTGQNQSFTLTCQVPSYCRDINEVDMVGFIQDDGNQKIAQTARALDCVLSPIALNGPEYVCSGETATLTASGGTTYLWSNGQTGNSLVVPASTSNYWVMSTDFNACPNIAAIGIRASNCTGLSVYTGKAIQVNIYPNPTNGEFVITADIENGLTTLIIYDVLGKKVFEQTLSSEETVVKANLAKGLYNYQLFQSLKSVHTGKLIID